MKIRKFQSQKISDRLYFVKNENLISDIIELENEFGVEEEKEYLEFVKRSIKKNNLKRSTLIISIFESHKYSSFKHSEFSKMIYDSNIKSFDIKRRTSSELYETYILEIYDRLCDTDIEKVFEKYDATLVLLDGNFNCDSVEINESFNYHLNYDKLLNDLAEQKIMLISKLLFPDMDTYFIIEGKVSAVTNFETS